MKRIALFLLLTATAGAVPWAGGGRPPVRMRPMPQMRVINADNPGEKLDLAGHVQPGKYTVVDFFAEW